MTSPVSRGHPQHLSHRTIRASFFLIGTVTNPTFVVARNRCHRHMIIVAALEVVSSSSLELSMVYEGDGGGKEARHSSCLEIG